VKQREKKPSFNAPREEPSLATSEPTQIGPKDIGRHRGQFMAKLLETGVLEVEKKAPVQNIVIFDWDDTLLCTTYFNPEKEGNLDVVAETYKDILIELDNLLIDLFEKSFKNCIPIIVTNAVQGWVEFTSSKLLPKAH